MFSNYKVVNTLSRDRSGVQIIQDMAARRPIPRNLIDAIMKKTKNPSQIMHELGQYYNIEISFKEEIGPYGSTTHRMSCNFNNHHLATGEGRTKKEANAQAAKSAFLKIIGLENPTVQVGETFFDSNGNSTHTKMISRPIDQSNIPLTMHSPNVKSDPGFPKAVEEFEANMKQMQQGYRIVVDDKIQQGYFWVEYLLDNESLGAGKDSLLRNAQCLAALASSKILEDHAKSTADFCNNSLNGANSDNDSVDDKKSKLDDKDAGEMFSTLKSFLSQLLVKIEDKSIMSKSIAAFFVKKASSIHLVSFGAGTGIVQSRLVTQANGRTLNNCHALVIAQRALKRYLWYEIINFKTKESKNSLNILEFDETTGKLKLKGDVDFFLFVNHPPCGDPTDINCDKKGLLHYINCADELNNKNHDELNWGDDEITSYEKTSPVIPSQKNEMPVEIQTFASIRNGDDFRAMSCTDKLTMWNVLGLQGSLINIFLEAIYLSRIITCGEIYEDYLEWTTFLKFKNDFASNDFKLPSDFVSVNPGFENMFEYNPFIQFCDSDETRLSINWYFSAREPEIVDSATGLSLDSNSSRLCKAANLFYFQQSSKLMPSISCKYADQNLTYDETKELNSQYKESKNIMHKMIAQTQYGKMIVHKQFGNFRS